MEFDEIRKADMGEIKSTLDLVMEKTKNLSLSPEEKAEQKRAEFEKRLQGLLQQYADDAVSMDTLKDHIRMLQEEFDLHDATVPLDAVFTRIDPDKDNWRWLYLLDTVAPAAANSLKEILSEYDRKRADLGVASGKRILEQFAQHHGIRGSAVVPNPRKDSPYQERLAALRGETQKRIDTIR